MSRDNRVVSAELYARASVRLPGGVNSPVRAFKSVGGTPLFVASASGATVKDVDENTYIDYVMSYGPMLLGHAPEIITQAIATAAPHGTAYGAPTLAEVELAELLCRMVPSVDMVRFVNSGSEATMSAIRLARGVTGRSKIVKCAGCFHGSVDSLLVSAGSGAATLGIPATAGVPESFAAETIVVEYNDHKALQEAFAAYGDQIAAFILEPIPANMGVVLPAPGYLELARELTAGSGSILIFDEVITGFRIGAAGAQGIYGIMPDLTCFGKIIGGGLPCGAYGGPRDIMEELAPLGGVYQAGTLSGNPVTTAAGLAMLTYIEQEAEMLYPQLNDHTARLAQQLDAQFRRAGIPIQIQQAGSLMTPFFSQGPVENYQQALQCDTQRFATFFHALLQNGVSVPPSQYEAWFISAAHDDSTAEQTLEATAAALSAITDPAPPRRQAHPQ